MDVQSLHAISERMSANLQLLGCAGEAVTVLRKRIENEFALKIRHDFIDRLPGGNHRELALAQAGFQMEFREVGGMNLVGGFKDDGALDDIAQLAHVAWPMMAQQLLLGGDGKAFELLVHHGIELSEEMIGQQQDIPASLAQRRRTQMDDIQAMEQTLAKMM